MFSGGGKTTSYTIKIGGEKSEATTENGKILINLDKLISLLELQKTGIASNPKYTCRGGDSIEFENGSTATHGMLCSAQRAGRGFFILGTHGEIEGWGGDGKIYVRTFDVENRDNIDKGKERVIDFTNNDQSEAGGHFGGDYALMRDFIDYLMGKEPSISCTQIDDSIYGHLCVYAADKSRLEERTVYISEYEDN